MKIFINIKDFTYLAVMNILGLFFDLIRIIKTWGYCIGDKIFFKNTHSAQDVESVRLVAFYLPQFHHIAENDEWWGKGFTDWSNVSRGKPLFKGHYQPKKPAEEIGFYNLLDPEVQKKQVKLAKDHGIYGFCFYHYWFKGKKLLEKPVEAFIENKKVIFHFCLCWANEPWTRRWDGREDQVLQIQKYGGEEDWIEHFKYLLSAFKDDRAIKIDGKPVFLIYRIGHIDNVKGMIRCWREQAGKYGLPGLYIIAALNRAFKESMNFEDINVDAVYEFAPFSSKSISKRKGPVLVTDYDRHWQSLLEMKKRFPVQFRGAFVSWDNTARRGNDALIFHGATPEKYKRYLRRQIIRTLKEPEDKRYIFINAWNEWAEGCYLEPDEKHGRAYLEATKDALCG